MVSVIAERAHSCLGSLQRLGFHRVSPSGHTEKALEFGKDLWMKYHCPRATGYIFMLRLSKDKIDASGAGGNNNIAMVLNQD